MLKFVSKQLILVFFISMAMAIVSPLFAGSTVAISGQPAMVGVAFKIEIPPCLVLQVKTASADNMLASRTNNNSGNTTLPGLNDKTVNVTASAHVTRYGVLNVSSKHLSTGNAPTSIKKTELGAIESLPLPYISNGQYRLEYTPAVHPSFPSPDNSPTIILCSP